MRKFIPEVEQITFNGRYAAEKGQQVLYVTERCVFRLTLEGLELIEVAPGIDIDKDILAHMEFEPIIKTPALMDAALFSSKSMGLKKLLINVKMQDRLTYDDATNTVFINIAGTAIETLGDLKEHERVMHKFFGALDKKVNIISNFDGRVIAPKMRAAYADFQAELERKYFLNAARYTTSAFLRQKMGQDLKARDLAPHIFETAAEAAAYIKATQD